MNLYRLGACLKCRGDLAYDEGDWKCLQCGVYYYTGLYPESKTPASGDPLLRIVWPRPRWSWDGDDFLAQAAD